MSQPQSYHRRYPHKKSAFLSQMKHLLHWFAGLPIALVATHSIMVGVVLSAAEWDGWITWGHEGSIVMILPIIVWALLQRSER